MKNIKQHIIEQSIKLLIKKPKASMDEIAEFADVGRATLFRHIKNRKMLIFEITVHAYHVCNEVLDPIINLDIPAKEKLELAIMKIIPHGADYNFLYREEPPGDVEFIEGLNKLYLERWSKIIIELKKEKIVDDTLPDAWLIRALDHLIIAAWEGIDHGEIAQNDAHKLVLKTFLRNF